MISMPPAANHNTNAAQRQMAPQSQGRQTNVTLQGRFPGWSFMDSVHYANGAPQKAHIKDRAGHVRTVWFDMNERITREADGNQ